MASLDAEVRGCYALSRSYREVAFLGTNAPVEDEVESWHRIPVVARQTAATPPEPPLADDGVGCQARERPIVHVASENRSSERVRQCGPGESWPMLGVASIDIDT